ncbi:hypothetical protein ACQEU3_07320 [Spirillospora sp. CA-253888]
MARTAHHVRPRRAHLTDLRYSRETLAEAARNGHRPRPQRVRRAIGARSFARALDDGWVAWYATVEERRERRRLRLALGRVRALANAGGPEAGEAVVLPPGRHRRGALWSL